MQELPMSHARERELEALAQFARSILGPSELAELHSRCWGWIELHNREGTSEMPWLSAAAFRTNMLEGYACELQTSSLAIESPLAWQDNVSEPRMSEVALLSGVVISADILGSLFVPRWIDWLAWLVWLCQATPERRTVTAQLLFCLMEKASDYEMRPGVDLILALARAGLTGELDQLRVQFDTHIYRQSIACELIEETETWPALFEATPLMQLALDWAVS